MYSEIKLYEQQIKKGKMKDERKSLSTVERSLAYRIIITRQIEELINFCTYYIINNRKNPKIAEQLLNGVDELIKSNNKS